MTINEILAKELNISLARVEKTVALIDEGNTIPFIARYRKRSFGIRTGLGRTDQF